MAKGNINSTLNLLTNNVEIGVLPLDKNTLSKLIQKHPKGKTASQDILLKWSFTTNSSCQGVIHLVCTQNFPKKYNVNFSENFTYVLSGPSGMDVDAWRRILASINLGHQVLISVSICKCGPKIVY